jgi:hypothetical protein
MSDDGDREGERWWRRARRQIGLELHYIGKGYESIAEGMVSIFSFGRIIPRSLEVDEILKRSDRDALYGDWAKIAGDFDVVGRRMNVSLHWMLEEVEAAKARGDSVEEMQANILRKYSTMDWTEASSS